MNLIYWNIQGYAEPLRYFLEYLKLDYKEINPRNKTDFQNMQKFTKFNSSPITTFPIIFDKLNITSTKLSCAKFINSKVDIAYFGANPIDKVKHRMLTSLIGELNKNLLNL